MRDYILSFCNEFGYPSEARQALLSAYDRLSENDAGFAIFCENVELYNKEALNNHDSALASLDQASEMSNVHRYTVHLLFYICLSRHTRELYKQKNIPDRIFYDSMSDLKWKLFECHNVYGIWGSFVASWFKRFFDLARFALGRLQFETIEFTREYSKNGYMLHPGDIVLNIHIPSCGPLTKEACLESYRKAASFFKEYFIGRPTAFVCNSWLLFPQHKEFLPPTSHIISFMDDFDVIFSATDEKFSNSWRIFHKEYNGSTEDLPCDTSLQRAYINWLSQGGTAGGGFGVFFFDDGKIV